jgi:DNA helicase II / ATP-dependent DNA helicase PcrA
VNTYLNELNDIQRAAVTTTEGPVLVVAGPGSGKTKVLTYRIAHLIEQGVAPWEILALTFTNKAAREMHGRISAVVGGKASDVWAGTFHAIFARILRAEADKIGYPKNFTIYDTEDSKSVISSIIKEKNLDRESYNVNLVRARISSAKNNLITPKMYQDDDQLREEDRRGNRSHLYAIYEAYTSRCKRAGAMDFDDLLYRLYELLHRNPDQVLEKYRKRFRYLLVDEFQDTNHLQYAIVRKLIHFDNSPRNVCVVGDDAQSIYAFRGATIQNILDFEQDFKPYGIRVFKLEQNYRSTEHIVQSANELIQRNSRQIQKKIWSDKGEGHRVKILRARTDSEEGGRVVDTLLEQKNRYHLRHKDIAILYRTNAQSRIFEEQLRRFNIPYRVFGGMSFYQRKEVKDLIAYLRLVVNPGDEEALRRSINNPKRGIGDTTLDKIIEYSNQHNLPLWECLEKVDLGARTKHAIGGFVQMMASFQGRVPTDNAYDLALDVISRSGIMDMLKQDTTVEGLGRLDNVNSLLDAINIFVSDELDAVAEGEEADVSLSKYLQNIALLTDADEKITDEDFVTLMSVHAAKGLEFASVFVVGLEENLFPSFMSIDSPEGLEEERRLFYVAITRAERFLTLSYADSRHRYGSSRSCEPSRFLDEIPRKHVESTAALRATPETTVGSVQRAGVSGAPIRKSASNQAPKVDPDRFKPSPSSMIQAGMRVLHLKFGEGLVTQIEGGGDSRMAAIAFEGDEVSIRRIMLRFAKLQILD